MSINEILKAFPTIGQSCPYCGHQINHAGLIPGQQPRPPEKGDVSVCIKCAEISMFDIDLKLKQLEDFERLNLMLSSRWPLIEKTINVIKKAKSKHETRQGRNR